MRKTENMRMSPPGKKGPDSYPLPSVQTEKGVSMILTHNIYAYKYMHTTINKKDHISG